MRRDGLLSHNATHGNQEILHSPRCVGHGVEASPFYQPRRQTDSFGLGCPGCVWSTWLACCILRSGVCSTIEIFRAFAAAILPSKAKHTSYRKNSQTARRQQPIELKGFAQGADYLRDRLFSTGNGQRAHGSMRFGQSSGARSFGSFLNSMCQRVLLARAPSLDEALH